MRSDWTLNDAMLQDHLACAALHIVYLMNTPARVTPLNLDEVLNSFLIRMEAKQLPRYYYDAQGEMSQM